MTTTLKRLVGRKYQHIEDLVFTNGSIGGLHAVERMQDMCTHGGSIELKWDGSPVVYWGRDANNRFMLIPKNAWEYLKRGKLTNNAGVSTLMYSPQDIERFILSTGKTQDENRKRYAVQIAALWESFEEISPQHGFVEGSLMFYPESKPVSDPTGMYEFTPNITTFHIPRNSLIGEKINHAKIMVAATGYYSELGSNDESRITDAGKLSSTKVLVQGTVYVQDTPEISTVTLESATQFIADNSGIIDSFLEGERGLSNPGEVLYKFYNQCLRLPNSKHKFKDWVITEFPTGAKAQKILNRPGLEQTLTAVEILTNAKLEIIYSLKSNSHCGIKQTNPEGYVQAHPDRQFKHQLTGQFIKLIDQSNWAPRKD